MSARSAGEKCSRCLRADLASLKEHSKFGKLAVGVAGPRDDVMKQIKQVCIKVDLVHHERLESLHCQEYLAYKNMKKNITCKNINISNPA